MKKISILGVTGSIGTQTLDVIRMHHEQFQLVAISVGRNIELARKIINEFKPKIVSFMEKEDAITLKAEYSNITFLYGMEGLVEVATYKDVEVVVTAVVGSVGLVPTLKAIEAKKTIALANKETLVTAGHIVMEHAKKYGVDILPVDSEHSAIFQSLNGESNQDISKIILTASGGSFRDKTREELVNVTVEDALNHPNWSMGAKITIDSASMMNKGLEVIEAHWLFNVNYEQIDVLLHRESIIHSMVEFNDTSVIAQLGTPDMRVPIQYALTYPRRDDLPKGKRLNLWEIGTLHFEQMNLERFKCLDLAFQAGKMGGSMPVVLNAANEIAVESFLSKKISFLQIEEVIEEAMQNHQVVSLPELEEVTSIDELTRKFTTNLINQRWL